MAIPMTYAILIQTTEGAYLHGPFLQEEAAEAVRQSMISSEIDCLVDPTDKEEDDIKAHFTILCMTQTGDWTPEMLRSIPQV